MFINNNFATNTIKGKYGIIVLWEKHHKKLRKTPDFL